MEGEGAQVRRTALTSQRSESKSCPIVQQVRALSVWPSSQSDSETVSESVAVEGRVWCFLLGCHFPKAYTETWGGDGLCGIQNSPHPLQVRCWSKALGHLFVKDFLWRSTGSESPGTALPSGRLFADSASNSAVNASYVKPPTTALPLLAQGHELEPTSPLVLPQAHLDSLSPCGFPHCSSHQDALSSLIHHKHLLVLKDPAHLAFPQCVLSWCLSPFLKGHYPHDLIYP